MMTVCPGCGRLVHTDELNQLVQLARDAESQQDFSTALANWRQALALLPPGTKQYQIIADKITQLGKLVGSSPPIPPRNQQGPRSKLAAGASAVAFGLWKLKALLLGLTKATTLLTMMVSFGFYWKIFGWPLALGLILSIYIHEMGHVIALRKLGFKATAPMFIPGLGAVVLLKQQVVNPLEDAEIGLAGPIYGAGAAITTLILWYFTQKPIFAAIAGLGAWINLFNLMPVWTLDGGRGFHAMSKPQKLLAAAVVGGAWYYTQDGLLALVGILCVYNALTTPAQVTGKTLKPIVTYILLVLTLTAISLVRPMHPIASDQQQSQSTSDDQ